MTKKEKRQLKEAIANEEYIDQNNELIFKKLIFNPLLRAGGLLILLIFSLIISLKLPIKQVLIPQSHFYLLLL